MSDARLDQATRLLAGRNPAAALAVCDEVLEDSPDDVRAWQGRGRALNNLRRFDEAEAAFRRATELDPGDASNHNFLGHVLRAAGRSTEAARVFREAIAADASLAVAHYNLGTVLAMSGDYAGAVVALERSLGLGRNAPETLLNLGELYQFLERYGDAADAYERALKLEPGNATVHSLLGDLWYSLGEVENARATYDAALAADAGCRPALAGRALLDELWGDIDAGLERLAGVPAGDDAGVDYARARLLRRKGDVRGALEVLQRLPGDDPRHDFTLGEVLDELGDFPGAFAAFSRANANKPAPFDPAAHSRLIDRLIRYFDADRLAVQKRVTGRPMPLFIVGMPRSGTSLVEQVLATHSQVHAGGERFELPQRLLSLGDGYPDSLEGMAPHDFAEWADDYRHSYGPVGTAAAWTDKLPKNFLNLGLIALMFPEARVIYCRRDPRDTGLSVFFQNMNFRSDPWTSRLEHISAYTHDCERIMAHWKTVLPLPMLELDYESMVADSESEIRRLLEFAGLPWEPACLEFHRTRRLVNTASYAQVRRPVYTSSVGRWKNYAEFLGPLSR